MCSVGCSAYGSARGTARVRDREVPGSVQGHRTTRAEARAGQGVMNPGTVLALALDYRSLRHALPHRVRRVVAAGASGQKVPRARIHGRVLQRTVVAALHRALPADVRLALRLRGSRAAEHVGALDAGGVVAAAALL